MEKGAKGGFTVLAEGTCFEGNIKVPHSIHIDGNFKGIIETSGTLTVGKSGVLEANILAKSAIFHGKIVGNVIIEGRVEMESSSSLLGDLTAKDLVIHEGAIFHGKCSMEKQKPEKI